MNKNGASARLQNPVPSFLQRMLHRLRRDFHLSLLTLFVTLATLALGPFFIYRVVQGDVIAAIGNSSTLLVLLAAFSYAWIRGRTEGARRAIVVFIALASVFMVTVVGHLPYWTFPTVVANFMLVHWRFALIVNALMILAVVFGAPFFEQLVDVLSYLAAIVMVGLFSMIFAIHTNFHRDRLSELVSRDALTGTLNRRVLRDDLSDAIRQSQRLGQPAALALLDLDNFKQVNDIHGHEVGDQVLIDLSRLVDRQSRKSDRFYRLGGEEFVLLLNQTDADGAVTAMDKLMDAVRQHLNSPAGPVTVSIGVAVLEPEESWAEWLARADQAMYRAKGAGKDQVVFADSKA